MGAIKITLNRSSINTSDAQRSTLKGLGLRRIGRSRVLENTPAVRGMVKSVLHLVTVEAVEVSDG